MADGLAAAVQLQDHTITARDGTPLEARSYRPAGIPTSQRLPVYDPCLAMPSVVPLRGLWGAQAASARGQPIRRWVYHIQ
jgi:predicted acyl esterase